MTSILREDEPVVIEAECGIHRCRRVADRYRVEHGDLLESETQQSHHQPDSAVRRSSPDRSWRGARSASQDYFPSRQGRHGAIAACYYSWLADSIQTSCGAGQPIKQGYPRLGFTYEAGADLILCQFGSSSVNISVYYPTLQTRNPKSPISSTLTLHSLNCFFEGKRVKERYPTACIRVCGIDNASS
jgi:hypothetical protein